MKLDGQVAVITGASRGIGRAIALRFAGEGASLVLNHRSDTASMQETVTACEQAGAKVLVCAGDIADTDLPDRLVSVAMQEFGRVDVVVNNAAVVFEELVVLAEDAQIAAMIATNITAVVRMTRAAVRVMLAKRRGVVINLSSVAATQPGRGSAVYAGTKGFVESFTRATAAEVARKGIRVNGIAPGVVETQMNASLRAVAGEELRKRIAQKRFGLAEEVASVAAWLASEEASYVNGTVIAVDGGYGLGS